jgi:hypothetical protein
MRSDKRVCQTLPLSLSNLTLGALTPSGLSNTAFKLLPTAEMKETDEGRLLWELAAKPLSGVALFELQGGFAACTQTALCREVQQGVVFHIYRKLSGRCSGR